LAIWKFELPDSPTNPSPSSPTFVSRGGLKLHHALTHFQLSVQGLTAADFGCSTGGFTDCLLQRGAAKVYAVDTGYGVLDWKLRNDPRVVVMERTNCLHAAPPSEVVATGGVDLIVIDASWTPQRLVIPAALAWLKQSTEARIISLIKPHYEFKDQGNKLPHGGILDEHLAEKVAPHPRRQHRQQTNRQRQRRMALAREKGITNPTAPAWASNTNCSMHQPTVQLIVHANACQNKAQ
jgi:23S rRNA (cytidine1920-2'-O)/16S rRNA (cytidine1409-2'-O)-methyltransferase